MTRSFKGAGGVVVFVMLLTSSAWAAAPAAKSLEIGDLLKMNSKKQVLELAVSKTEALAVTLAQVRDEGSAKQLQPSIERTYLEMMLVTTRLQMLGLPTDSDRADAAASAARFQDGVGSLKHETMRIAQSSTLMPTLRGTIEPLKMIVGGNDDAKANSLVSQLQMLRSQIELYKLQHLDRTPDFRHFGWKQLTSKTDRDGNIKVDGQFGPYIQVSPLNFLMHSTHILLTRGEPKANFRYDKGDCGFVYDETSGKIWALNGDGRIFDESSPAQAVTRAE